MVQFGSGHDQWGGLSCKHCKGPFSSVKGREYFDQLSDYKLLKTNPVQWSQITGAGRVASKADSQAVFKPRWVRVRQQLTIRNVKYI
jgi:hypothetical protein